MKKCWLLTILLYASIGSYQPAQADFSFSNYLPETIKNHPIATGFTACVIPIASWSLYHYFYGYELRWNWSKIEINEVLSFPSQFWWGTASSALQIEGTKTYGDKQIENSWTEWEKKLPEEKRMGSACNHWNRYEEDMQLAADIGMNCYRYSIEWSKVEPEKGVFDDTALQHYIDYTKALLAKGLRPIPTLFHHAWPLWLKNGFETQESVSEFCNFAVHVFTAFKEADILKDVTMWLTFNEPAGYALAAYVHGDYPPGKHLELKLCGTVLKNMLDAHIAVYDACKKIDPKVQISLAHMMQPIKPYNPWNPLDYLPARIFDHLLNDVTLIYLTKGTFNWLRLLNEQNNNAIGKLDFIAVNYYTFTLLKNFKQAKRPHEIFGAADEGSKRKAIYAEGFYSSLKKVASLMPGIPIFITENGISILDADIRSLYYKRHLYVLHKLLQEGLPIIGYLVWTLTDCYGWNSGNSSRYGIYAIDFEDSEQPRTLRDGNQYLLDVINKK